MEQSDKPKVFGDYPQVDCNQCENYWLNLCDSTNKEILCKHYKATRKVVIPMQIEHLQHQIKVTRLVMSCEFGLTAGAIFTITMHLLGVL